MIKYLPLKRINEPYVHAADSVLQGGWYLRGEATASFEEHYAHYIGTRHCIGCGNGLDALTLILRAYKELGRLADGDEVIVPANTFIASILAITECALTPILVEPRLDTFQIDDSLIEAAITDKTRALMLVHLYGRCAYTEKIGDLCKKYSLLLIEDNAQAHGCSYRPLQAPPKEGVSNYLMSSHVSLHPSLREGLGGLTGSLGNAAAHSFYPGKNLGAFGDAGAVTTDDDQLADVVRALGNYGSRQRYVFEHLGRNSRIDEVQAAILDAKLKNLDSDNARRQEIANHYIANIHNPLVALPAPSTSVYHIFPILCPRRDALRQYLADNGVETQVHYPIPPHKQACYPQWHSLSLPVTELIHSQELSLPCHQAMTQEEADIVVGLLNRFA